MKNKKVLSITDIVFIALFAAMAYVSVWAIRIPIGPMFVHPGNMVVVIAALLLGGWKGGLAGSLGMGLFDLLNGYADSAPKTIVLKFLIGFVTGAVYLLMNRVFKNDSKKQIVSAFIGATAGLLVNLIGETLYKLVYNMLLGSTFSTSITIAVTAQVSTVINAVISIVGGVLIFLAVKKPYSHLVSSNL